MLTIIQILQVLLDVVWWIIIADFVLSILIAFNVVNTYNGFVRSLYDGIERLLSGKSMGKVVVDLADR